MNTVPFKSSPAVSLGMELEFQIVSPKTFCLVSSAKELIRHIKESPHQQLIKPEITQSMIEINSSIHTSTKEMLDELQILHAFLMEQGNELDIAICGGGTHPFQRWSMQKIFPTFRYKNLSKQYRFLSKRATVFGLHLHVGCSSGEDAIYLTHALARYVPHFIAISASSPFYQGVDTGYHSSRSTVFNAFPLSGVMPYLSNWQEFSDYYYKMHNIGIITSMKDFYWDIRPKPEFGTVEIRVFDTPLSIKKALIIAAYVQALSLYLLEERTFQLSHNLYYLYNYNRFQASRYGFDGIFFDPQQLTQRLILDDMLETFKKIERYANQLNNMGYITKLLDDVVNKKNDAATLKTIMKQVASYPKLVDEQCKIWANFQK